MNLSIKEKIYGAVFGYAIGDAIGIGSEFMTAKEVKLRYPGGLKDYSQFIRDAHRAQWKKGEWSNDTELVLTVLGSFLRKGHFDYLDIARSFKAWYDSDPVDLTSNLRNVFSLKGYTDNPFETILEAWKKTDNFENTSECLGRAIFSFLSPDTLETASALCRLTHPMDRTVASCKVIAFMANSLFRHDRAATLEELTTIARNNSECVTDYVETAFHGTLEDFHLDDEDTYWFVRKSLGAALWCVWHTDSFEKGVDEVINQGGDADTNAAAAGALLGLKYGYSQIPAHLIDGLLGKERLREICDGLIRHIESKK